MRIIFPIVVIILLFKCCVRDPMNLHEDAYDELVYDITGMGVYYYDIDMTFDTVIVDDKYYRYRFYQIYPGEDTMRVSLMYNADYPYFFEGTSFNNKVNFLKYSRFSLSNFFDTSRIDSTRLVDYVDFVQTDSAKWILSKEKISNYLRQGQYSVDRYDREKIQIMFYVPVARGLSGDKDIYYVWVERLSDNRIALIPSLNGWDNSIVSDDKYLQLVYYRIPFDSSRIDPDWSMRLINWIFGKEK